MFYVIKNDNLYEFGDRVHSAWEFPQEAKELAGVSLFEFQQNRDKYLVQNGCLVDISKSEEYLSAQAEKAKEIRKSEIITALDALDMKCIRALREGGEDEDGIPFLQKYQSEIMTLREEYNSL